MADPALEPYLAGLALRGRRVVVVGAGSVARRRVQGLLAAEADVLVVSPEVSTSVAEMAVRGRLQLLERRYAHGDLAGAWYVLACTDDPAVNSAVVAEATATRTFCVRADDAARGTVVTPATGTHDGLIVGTLAHGDHSRSAAVRTALVEALQSGAVDAHPPAAAAGVALVGGGPGDADLITVRGLQLLSRADVVVVDRLGPTALLGHVPAHAEIVDAGKVPHGRSMSQEDINRVLVDQARAGSFVVRLKGGDPYVFGRGYEELLACTAAGVPVTVVPGVSSAFGVPAVAGIPVTHRGVAHEVVVVSGHVPPGDPTSLVDWAALGRLRGTLVLLMAVHAIGEIAAALVQHGRDPGTPVAVVQEGSTTNQRRLSTTLARVAQDVADGGFRAPAVVVVGTVAEPESLTGLGAATA